MQMRAEIATPWTGTGTETDPNRPLVADSYPLASWSDATGQPAENLNPDPNMFVIEVVAGADVLTAIDADDRFAVLWAEPIEEAVI